MTTLPLLIRREDASDAEAVERLHERAVEPAFTSRGIGFELIAVALDAARQKGDLRVILVGDEPYYRRSGFSKVPKGRLELPGPVDPDRLLWLELVPGAFDGISGAVLPA